MAGNDRLTMDLSGQWRFAFDPNEIGDSTCGGWYEDVLPDTVLLPGTTVTNQKGVESLLMDRVNVVDRYAYRGVAWYQRDVIIPDTWAGKHVELLLERANNTTVWVDDAKVGTNDNLYAPQRYNLTDLAHPGKHTVTVRNNSARVRPEHCYRVETVNGILGKIELAASDRVWVGEVRIDPDVPARRAVFHIQIHNTTGCRALGEFVVRLSAKGRQVPAKRQEFLVEFDRKEKFMELEVYLGPDALLWDEFEPNLYDVEIEMQAKAGAGIYADRYTTRFGLREFNRRGTQFAINGKTVLLRGDALLFEKFITRPGGSLFDVEDWKSILRIYKEYGINHLRFHTHCPPEAAFTAADELGIYMQPELTLGGTNGMHVPGPNEPAFDPLLEPTIKRLGTNLILWLQNHPSFVALALGNEINGDRELLKRLVDYFRSVEPKRMYAQGSNNFIRDYRLAEGDDYWTTMKTASEWERKPVRASFAHSDPPIGAVQDELPRSTMRDFSESIEGIPVPVIGHEIGQYETTPDYSEISRFPDYEIPSTLIKMKSTMERRGLSHKEKDFYRDSGKLCLLCYREDIEMFLRTPGMGGFQILSLGDINSSGTALTGILNGFMETKGILTAREWRSFCSDRVMLLRMEKFVYDAGERLTGKIQLANYGPSAIEGAKPYWKVSSDGRVVAEGKLPALDIPQGGLFDLGTLEALLAASEPSKLTLEIGLEGLDIANTYPVWVYPAAEPATAPAGVLVTHTLDSRAAEELAHGGKVLLFSGMMTTDKTIEGHFAANFWSYLLFRGGGLDIVETFTGHGRPTMGGMLPPATEGLSYDPSHPVMRYLRSAVEGCTDYPWFETVMHSNPVILSEFPSAIEPIVWMIDNPLRGHRLGFLFEMKVGNGSLLVSAADLPALPENRHAQCFYRGILEYMNSPAFKPSVSLSMDFLKAFFS